MQTLVAFILALLPLFFACGTADVSLFVADDVCNEVLKAGVSFGTRSVRITTAQNQIVDLTVQVADAEASRSQGLMCRSSLSEGSGMVFIFNAKTTTSFWMKNTHVPLDIAYIADGVIVDIREMRPCTPPVDEAGKLTAEWPISPPQCLDDQSNYDGGVYPKGYGPASSYDAALEVPKGYFKANGVTTGDRVQF